LIAKLLRNTTRNREPAASHPGHHHAHAPHPVLPLPLLGAGQRARVDAVLGEGDLIRRLRELGLCDGAEVCMVRPGCPCIIRMGSQKFCFRADELNTVLVRPMVAG
jgi:Fe2+ transport system protein FeoA